MISSSLQNCWRCLIRYVFLVCLCASAAGLTTEAVAGQRRFQMALWASSNPDYVDLSWFGAGEPQPAGRSILYIGPDTNVAAFSYDWSRIAAVAIDEPYWGATGGPVTGDWSNPCWNPDDPRNAAVASMGASLANVAAAVHSISTTTRFWINFSEPEVQWMMDYYCPLPLDQSYIDVISLDKYNVPFSSVKPYYDWLAAYRPKNSQQLALVPGTFYIESPNYLDPYYPASWLQGYFDYANSMNSVGWDAPMVWLIAGWPAGDGSDPYYPGDIGGGNIWRGIFTPYAGQIATAWRRQFLSQRVDNFAGVVEYLDPFSYVSGWAVDRMQETPPYVDFWVDGQYWGGTIATESRPDVGAYYGINQAGYTFWIPPWANDGGCHHLDAYAVAPTAEVWNHLLLSPLVSTDFCFGYWYPPYGFPY